MRSQTPWTFSIYLFCLFALPFIHSLIDHRLLTAWSSQAGGLPSPWST